MVSLHLSTRHNNTSSRSTRPRRQLSSREMHQDINRLLRRQAINLARREQTPAVIAAFKVINREYIAYAS